MIISCNKQQADSDSDYAVSSLGLTKAQQNEIISEHIVALEDKYELNLTEKEALQKGISKLNYDSHTRNITGTNLTIQRLKHGGDNITLIKPLSANAYKTKCDECSLSNVISLAPFAVGNNRYSFTSRYNCIKLYPFLTGGTSVMFESTAKDVFGRDITVWGESLVIRDLDGIASPNVVIGLPNMGGEIFMHKHSDSSTLGYKSPKEWNIEAYIIGNTGPTYTGSHSMILSYRNANCM